MVKGIIVLDVPEECRKCPFQEVSEENHMWCLVSYLDDCSRVSKMILDEYSKPDWCPVRVLPEMAHHEDYCDNGRYDKGWKALPDGYRCDTDSNFLCVKAYAEAIIGDWLKQPEEE